MNKIKIVLIYFSLGLSFIFASGQQIGNYINNGSFEDSYNCSTNFLSACKYWTAIDTTAYGGAAYTRKCFGQVPLNGNTYQYASSGEAYVLNTFYNPGGPRGYVRNKMKTHLQQGITYCVKFHINICNSSPWGIDGFGAYFTDNSIDTINYENIPLTYLTPQVFYPLGNAVVDTLRWTLVTGTFVANGTEKYVVLGNFLSDASVTTASINTPWSPQLWSDVCIDDVSCMPLNLSAYAGPDKFITLGDSVFIGRQPDFATDSGCIWYKLPNITTSIDTISGLWVKPTTTSTYVVRQELDCSSLKWDTVIVTININYVGLDKLQQLSDNINLFPNPTSSNLIVTTTSDIISFNITNNLGQMVRENEIKNNSTTIPTSDLASGLYQIHFKTKFGIVTKKFVKTN